MSAFRKKIFVLFTIIACSCSREEEIVLNINTANLDVEFVAAWSNENLPGSRTALQEDGKSIWWTANEKINAFYGSRFAGKFTSTNEEASEFATFQGSLTVVTGAGEDNSASQYWAVYPYNTTNSCDGKSVTLTVSSAQSAVSGTFSDKSFPAIARSSSFNLSFYNVCGGARFSVNHEGVRSIVFKSIGGNPMAGRIRVSFGEDGKPEILEISNPVDSIVVYAPEGGFIPGNNYFAAMIPQEHDEGIRMILRTKEKKACKILSSPIAVRRSTFGILNQIDMELEYEDDDFQLDADPNGIIEFADQIIKEDCIAAFDTNDDGELSIAEAAAVTDISKAFTKTDYTSFNEFCFFTGITEIPAGWFKGKSKLEAISFSKNITSIGNGAFYGCKNLKSVQIPSVDFWFNLSFPDVYCSPFYSSSDGHLYIDGVEITKIIIPEGVTEISRYRFYNCAGINDVTLPESLKIIGNEAFNGCKALTKVHIPNLSVWMDLDYKNRPSAPFNASGEGMLYINDKEVTEILIPEDVTKIKQYTFHNCTGVKKMILEPTVPPVLGQDAFTGTRCFFYVWKECLKTYKSSWKDFSQRIVQESFLQEMIDLGLSVKWGVFNLGAFNESDPGFYYSWSEVVPKDNYSWGKYIWCGGNDHSLTKYCSIPEYGAQSFQDNKMITDPEDDAALYMLDDQWRIPSDTEWAELRENCTWQWTSINGVYGIKISSNKTGYTDNWIFLPASGFWNGTTQSGLSTQGDYWSSVCNAYQPQEARSIHFSSNKVNRNTNFRSYGLSIRPVYGDFIHVNDISITDLKIVKGNTESIKVTFNPVNSSERGFSVRSSNSFIINANEDGTITAKTTGTATITVTSIDGGHTATCNVSVIIPVQSLSFDKSELVLFENGTPKALSADVYPMDATDKSVVWTSSDMSIATVSSEGIVSGIKAGVATITATTVDGEFTAQCTITVKPSPKKVDLGLSVKWASFNLSATIPEEYGDYYAWGETESKSDYTFDTYKWGKNVIMLTKYYYNSPFFGGGDNKTLLDFEDDAANAALGGSWRMPTDEEWTELREKCIWEWTTFNGVNGRKVTSKIEGFTDKWIFLPAAGERTGTDITDEDSKGYYWSSSLSSNQSNAMGVQFNSVDVNRSSSYSSQFSRCNGLTVRPVTE